MLTEIGEAIGQVAATIGGSVVGLGGHWGMGSGLVIEEGVVLTNAHNVSGPTARVVFDDGRIEEAATIGVEVDRDLALLGVDTRQLTPLRWEPETLGVEIGKPVIGLANPGGRGLRATIGFVSAGERSFRGPRGRRITGGFEHTALAPAGSSGGPVVDPDGSLVGINTRRLGRGFYLAQTADTGLRDLISSLRRGDQPQPRRLGIGLAPAEVARRLRRSMGLDDVPGLLVRLVEGGSPAEASGVREGDVLVTADGVPIGDVDDLHQILASAGDSVDIGLVRVNEHLMVTIRFP